MARKRKVETLNMNQPGWWRKVEWNGCLPRRRPITHIVATRRNLRRPAPAGMVQDEPPQLLPQPLPEPYNWTQHAIPTINQHGPSCAGQAWANWMELMIRRYIGQDALRPGEQIDGHAIWRRGRELFDGGSLVGGLTLFQAFHAMKDLGIVPEGAMMLDVTAAPAAMCEALLTSPLVQGHLVSEGWYETNPENGCIDHSKLPKPGDGGHATLLLDPVIQDGALYWLSQNSWGPDYGFHGYFLMSDSMWHHCYLGDGPVTAILPDGWTAAEGWRKHVTTTPK
jgi:hypothetical protein